MSYKTNDFGGNKLSIIDIDVTGVHTISSEPYSYLYYNLNDYFELHIDFLISFTVFVINPGVKLTFLNENGFQQALCQFDAIQCEGHKLKISGDKGAKFFIAGIAKSDFALKNTIFCTKEKDLYKVIKPWGSEVWINGLSHKNYSFKKIKINKNTKTSLQYHNFKQETNLLL